MLGVTYQQVQRYEAGTNKVTAALLEEIAKVFGAEVKQFYGHSSAQFRSDPDGMAEAQEALHPGANSQPSQEEISALIQVYSRIPDHVARERLVAFLKAMQPKPD